MNKKTNKNAIHHDDLLRKALLRLIDIYVPSRFKSERQMAEALGIIPSHFSQIKNGHKTIGKSTIEKIENGLNFGIAGIYCFAEDENNLAEGETIPDETLDSLVSKYKRSSEAIKLLVDLTLSNKKPPSWVSKFVLTMHQGLLEALSDEIKKHKKEKTKTKRS